MADNSITIDSSQYIEALKKLDERTAMLDRLTQQFGKNGARAFTQVEQAAKKAAAGPSALVTALQGIETNTKATTAAMGNLRSQFIDIGVGLQGGQNPLTVLSQQGPQIAEAFLSAEGAVAAFGSAVSTAATAGSAFLIPFLSVAAPLWLEYSTAQDQATAAAKSWNDAQEAALPLYDKALKDVQRLSELTEGSLTLDETKAKIAKEYSDQLEESNAPLKERLSLLQEELKTMGVTDVRYLDARKETERLTAEIEKNNRAAAEGAIASATVAEYNYAEAESERILAERKAQATEARKASKTAAKEEADALKELLFLRGVDEEIAKLGDFFETEKAGLEQNAALYVKYRTDLEAAGDARELAQTRAVDEQTRITNELAQGQAAALDFAATLSNEVSGALSDVADTMEKSNKRGAKAARAASVATGILSTSISALEAGASTVAALSSNPVTLPFALPAGVAMTAAVEGAYVAKVAAQKSEASFTDTPGPVRMGAAMGTSANFAANDTVVAARSPDSLLRQVLDAVRERPGPAPEIRSTRREPLGMRMAREPAILDLTSSLGRVTRGRING